MTKSCSELKIIELQLKQKSMKYKVNHYKVNHCKGCKTYIHHYLPPNDAAVYGCDHIPFNQDGDCPCSICIIKAMCHRCCENFINFRNQMKLIDKGNYSNV
jgi:hypothetical protein